MRVLLDYRAALRERSGVGEYAHQLARALLSASHGVDHDRTLELTLFSSSWKHRLAVAAELEGAERIDRRVPGQVLNFAWHRLGWPPAETLTGRRFDVTHSLHRLLMPARHAAQVVTIHDLYFLEAMTLGIPVVAADRGALPEVLGDAGLLVDPESPDAIAGAIERLVDDNAFAASCVEKGLTRSQQFSWDVMARRVYRAYERAIEQRCA